MIDQIEHKYEIKPTEPKNPKLLLQIISEVTV